jgi:hypothetical protein
MRVINALERRLTIPNKARTESITIQIAMAGLNEKDTEFGDFYDVYSMLFL